MATISHKACSACGLDKPASDFSPDSRAKTGLQSQCRSCASAGSKRNRDANIEQRRARERAYVQANKERVYARNNEYRVRNGDKVKAHKKAAYEAMKHDPDFISRRDAYAAANKDRKREYDREYRGRDPQKCLERATQWRKANPEKRAAIIRAYSARRRSQEAEGVSTAALAAWTTAQRKVCYWCGGRCPKGFHVDHYVPLSKGGPHELHNLVIACGPCNLKKNAKDPLVFAREVGRLL